MNSGRVQKSPVSCTVHITQYRAGLPQRYCYYCLLRNDYCAAHTNAQHHQHAHRHPVKRSPIYKASC